jgi:hypothetical protein
MLPAQAQSPATDQAAELHRAERMADSVMSQLHQTLDFEPILTETIAPEFVKLLRKDDQKETKAVSDRDLLRVSAATLTVLYLTQLLDASLKMDAGQIAAHGAIPPEVESALSRFDQAGQAYQQSDPAARQIENLLGLARNARAEMIKHIRPVVFSSVPYKTFLERYRSAPKVSTLPNSLGNEPVYEVCSEGMRFSMVGRGGTMKIVALAPAWMD